MIELLLTNKQLDKWNLNRLINPVTNRKIKENGPVYNKIIKLYNTTKNKIKSTENLNYEYYRRNKIDPLLLLELPLNNMQEKNLFKFEWKWNSYNGERLKQKDESGPLYFDPNTLIHFFYTNRINNLWIEGYNIGNDYIQGHYGDALGKFPDFEITGRGKHPEWYLFRLPIIDCYLQQGHCLQTVTMGPILTDAEIKKIYNLSKKYKDFYKKTFGYNRPNIVKMKNIYFIQRVKYH